MTDEIINRVQQSGLITLNLEQFLPDGSRIDKVDMADFLFMKMILKEKEYREQLKLTDWTHYQDKYVYVYCSVDAIIPNWAYMLLTSYLSPIAAVVHLGDESSLIRAMLYDQINQLDVSPYVDQRLIIKGCGSDFIDAGAYMYISQKLLPVVKTLMYGEPCSTVPIYKKKK